PLNVLMKTDLVGQLAPRGSDRVAIARGERRRPCCPRRAVLALFDRREEGPIGQPCVVTLCRGEGGAALVGALRVKVLPRTAQDLALVRGDGVEVDMSVRKGGRRDGIEQAVVSQAVG